MKPYTVTLFIISLIGALFSGYLAITKLLTTTCALSEPCPYFLGYPACYFGFALFLMLVVISTVLLFGALPIRRAARVLVGISVVGVLFATWFTIPEIGAVLQGATYTLGLPTCSYGLVFFIAAGIVSVKILRLAR